MPVSAIQSIAVSLALSALTSFAAIAKDPPALKQGDTTEIGNGTATIQLIQTLRYVQDDYTRRFKFDSYQNPKLAELRERYRLDQVIAPGKDEFEKQVLLMDWTHRQFKKFGRPSSDAKGAIDILQAVDQGHTFFCAHYAQTFVSCAASVGWIDRELALRRHQGVAQNGTSEHSVTEIWSNQYGKWIMLDPTSNMYLEKNGVPLNAWEIREEWFYNDGRDLVFSIGKERNKYKKSDLPIKLARFVDFGDLTVDPDELDKYGFIGYIPNTNLMDAGPDYGAMFISKDKLCDGTQWHKRTLPALPAVEPYFAMNQANINLRAEKENLVVSLRTFMPNFETYQIQIDGNGWKQAEEHNTWKLHSGANRFEARCMNKFEVPGPISVAEVNLTDKAGK